jgi:hypothetical protein
MTAAPSGIVARPPQRLDRRVELRVGELDVAAAPDAHVVFPAVHREGLNGDAVSDVIDPRDELDIDPPRPGRIALLVRPSLVRYRAVTVSLPDESPNSGIYETAAT